MPDLLFLTCFNNLDPYMHASTCRVHRGAPSTVVVCFLVIFIRVFGSQLQLGLSLRHRGEGGSVAARARHLSAEVQKHLSIPS